MVYNNTFAPSDMGNIFIDFFGELMVQGKGFAVVIIVFLLLAFIIIIIKRR